MIPAICPPSSTGRAPMRFSPSTRTASNMIVSAATVSIALPLSRSTAARVMAVLSVTRRAGLIVPLRAVKGHSFGGWLLSQMDIAAGIVASRRAKGPVATVAIEAMKFIAPIHLRDVISVYAHVERLGRTSMGVRIEVVAQRDLGATEVK